MDIRWESDSSKTAVDTLSGFSHAPALLVLHLGHWIVEVTSVRGKWDFRRKFCDEEH